MTRVHVLVEGQTEETFVRDLLAPHLATGGVYASVVVVKTKRVLSGTDFRGGVVRYRQVETDLRLLLGDSDATAVTTMIDFYGLPADFPGMDALGIGSPYERVESLQEAWKSAVDDRRFLPYLSLHEFEALLLVRPDHIDRTFPGTRLSDDLRDALQRVSSPEEIDDGPTTHPSARLAADLPTFRKRLHGPLIAKRIGLEPMRSRCPHFDRWVTRLERLS